MTTRRPSSRLLVAAAAAVVLAACGGVVRFGELDPPPGRQMIVAVTIVGNSALSDGAITAVLATYDDNLSVTGAKPLLDRTKLPTDGRRIESFYAANGHFDARVREWWVEEVDPERVRVFFRVAEGKPTLIQAIEFGEALQTWASEPEAAVRLERISERLPRLVPFAVGEAWTEAAYEEGKRRIREELVNVGFLYAEVVGDVYVDKETREAFVHLGIVPGPLTRIRAIVVTGRARISEARIQRRIDLRPGEIVLPSRLRATERDIYDLRVFYGVSAKAQRISLRTALGQQEIEEATLAALRTIRWEPEVEIEVRVQEMPIHEIVAGVGATVASARGEAYIRTGYRNRDFIGGLRFFEVEARPALVAIGGFTADEPDFAPALDSFLLLRQPSFFEEYLELSGRVGYRLSAEQNYRSHVVDFRPTFSRRFFQWITVAIGYYVGYFSYFDVDPAYEQDLSDSLGLAYRDSYLLSYLEQQIELDTRDSFFDPRKGFYGAVRTAQSLEKLGSDFDYVRIGVDLRGYFTPWSWLTIAVALRYGQAFDLYGTGIPLAGRFRAGGPNDHRGFGAGRMGPLVCRTDEGEGIGTDDTCAGSGAKKVFIGGNLLLEASVELRFYLPADFGLVLFTDAGEIWAESGNVDIADVNVAVGTGLRYYTAFGPIRIDFGFLVQPLRHARDLVFHFSIGQAF